MPRDGFGVAGFRVFVALLALAPQHVAEKTPASSNYDKLLFRIRRHGAQRTFAPVIEDQGYGFAQISQALLAGFTLTVCARNLGAVGDVPRAVLFANRRMGSF
jgi:hypothetical protein